MEQAAELAVYNSHAFCCVQSLAPPAELAAQLGVALADLVKLNPERTRHTVVASGSVLVLPKTYSGSPRLQTSKARVYPNFFSLDTSDWFPPKPSFRALQPSGREGLFGRFEFEEIPNATDGAIRILGDWAKQNIGSVQIPQLTPVVRSGRIDFFRRAHGQIQALFKDWEAAGVIGLIKTWHGSFVPRHKRISTPNPQATRKLIPASEPDSSDQTASLSNHSWGTAFDINKKWNDYKVAPARLGETGCVYELVEIAHQNGFYWGGHFTGRSVDGMHFEIAELR